MFLRQSIFPLSLGFMLVHYSSLEQLGDGLVIISEGLFQDVRRVLPKQGRWPGLWHLELTVSHSWACQKRWKAGSLLMTNPRKRITQAARGVSNECQEYHCSLHPCRCTVVLEGNIFLHVALLDSISSNCTVVIRSAYHCAGDCTPMVRAKPDQKLSVLSQEISGVGHSTDWTLLGSRE